MGRWLNQHRQELVQDLIELINIQSIAAPAETNAPFGEGCQNALIYFETLAQKYGFCTKNHGNYCLSVFMKGKSSDRELGLLGHLDTVPAGDGWTYAPFDATEKKGYVIGRGAIDNKGPLLMLLYTMRALKALDVPFQHSLRLIAGCDEEGQMRDMAHYLANHTPPLFTLNCDGAWPVCIGEKGILNADLTIRLENNSVLQLEGGEAVNSVPFSAAAIFPEMSPQKILQLREQYKYAAIETAESAVILRCFGKSAHCAVPQSGENAIRRLLQLLCKTKVFSSADEQRLNCLSNALADDNGMGLNAHYADRLSGENTCVPTLLSLNGDILRVHINVRYGITQPADQLLKRLQERCHQLGITLENIQISPPRYDDPNRPEIRLLLDTCHEFLPVRCHPYVMAGGTHSRVFPRSIPFGVVTRSRHNQHAFGGPHSADEAVSIDELITAGKVYAAALLRLDRFYSAGQIERSNR